jgi:hypothetical protein
MIKKNSFYLALIACLAMACLSPRVKKQGKVSSKGFLIFLATDDCFFIEEWDTTRRYVDCFENLIKGSKKEAIRIPGNWVDDLPKILNRVDTIRRTDVPPGFAKDLYEVHYVSVSITFTLEPRIEKKAAYNFRFKNGSLTFSTRQWAGEILDLKAVDFCK